MHNFAVCGDFIYSAVLLIFEACDGEVLGNGQYLLVRNS